MLLILLLIIIFGVFRFIYRNGPGIIKECNYNDGKIFTIDDNSYDGNEGIVDSNGNHVGSCGYLNFNSEGVSCDDLKQCSVIYAVPNNIYGEPATLKIRSIPIFFKTFLKSF